MRDECCGTITFVMRFGFWERKFITLIIELKTQRTLG
jgi:hypothetical protein